jgi:hypothetical protein
MDAHETHEMQALGVITVQSKSLLATEPSIRIMPRPDVTMCGLVKRSERAYRRWNRLSFGILGGSSAPATTHQMHFQPISDNF